MIDILFRLDCVVATMQISDDKNDLIYTWGLIDCMCAVDQNMPITGIHLVCMGFAWLCQTIVGHFQILYDS